ncbi:interleukin-8-like [Polymixia lowei]
MAFSTMTRALLLLVVVAVCIQLREAQFIPGARCVCQTTVKYVPGPISDFRVIESGPSCDTTQVIVTLTRSDVSRDVCLSPEGKLARAFVMCWNKINRDESQKMTCLNRRKKAK